MADPPCNLLARDEYTETLVIPSLDGLARAFTACQTQNISGPGKSLRDETQVKDGLAPRGENTSVKCSSNDSQIRIPTEEEIRAASSIIGAQPSSSRRVRIVPTKDTVDQGVPGFDLEAYIGDSPQIRLAIIKFERLDELFAIPVRDIRWSIDFQDSPVHEGEVILAFSEDQTSLEAFSSLIARLGNANQEDAAAAPSSFGISQSDGEVTAVVPAANIDQCPAAIIDQAVPNEGHATIADPTSMMAPSRPIRSSILLVAGGVLGAFGLWVILAYDVIPYLCLSFEHLGMFSLEFLDRGVMLGVFRFAVRKVVNFIAWINRIVKALSG
ncbi:hypothetical protein DFP72DRAFT_857811 [Ephemerocybe angulata]|uniref:Uncharacterized protein n=1 Tax=Ephemerocybe angulata TaxID=980116 RepID=A0A8H6LVZ8_9AGAR|nr:hypothetical protein DFP72DRAFT_857811 [Tulosesus angulatus]